MNNTRGRDVLEDSLPHAGDSAGRPARAQRAQECPHHKILGTPPLVAYQAVQVIISTSTTRVQVDLSKHPDRKSGALH